MKAAKSLITGPVTGKKHRAAAQFVAEPMRFGRLFLAGDAGHIVPPTGAKGLNFAATDVKYLSIGHHRVLREGSEAGIDALFGPLPAAIWRAERFSWWFTDAHASIPRRRSDHGQVPAS